jgi:hypothetical protein
VAVASLALLGLRPLDARAEIRYIWRSNDTDIPGG